MLSSLPAWRFVDPLPVLSALDDAVADEDEESLQSIVSNVATSTPENASDRGGPL
jgi:hypothetical protein